LLVSASPSPARHRWWRAGTLGRPVAYDNLAGQAIISVALDDYFSDLWHATRLAISQQRRELAWLSNK
jgi:hypothetical protein